MNIGSSTDFSIDARSLHERVYDTMRQALLQGRFKAGQTLTIRELASELKTSEMPVREAIKTLVAEKMLAQLPNRSFIVPRLGVAEFSDLIDLRILLEGMAVRAVAASADADLVAALRAANDNMREAVAQNSNLDVLRHNQEFHFLIYRAGAASIRIEVIEMLWTRCGPYMAEALFEMSDMSVAMTRATDFHDGIVDAIAKGDPEAAFASLEQDLLGASGWYRSFIEQRADAR